MHRADLEVRVDLVVVRAEIVQGRHVRQVLLDLIVEAIGAEIVVEIAEATVADTRRDSLIIAATATAQ